MAVWSLVDKKSFAFGERYDAEFYQPDFVKVRKRLSKGRTLGSCLRDIRYGLQAEPEYLVEGAEYVRAMNLNVPWIDDQILRINPQQIPNDEYRLCEGDILITRTGANCGAVGIITERFTGATFGSYTIRLRTNDTVNPFALFAFLLSEAGKTLTTQARYGSAQPNLSIPYLRNLILVPNFSEELGRKVKQIILDAVMVAHSEADLYREAEAEMLDRLNWDALKKQPVEKYYIRNFTDITAAGRHDPEHFQPQYDRLRAHLSKHGETLVNLVTRFDKGTQPNGYSENGEVMVVKSKQVTSQGLSLESCDRTTDDAWADVSARLFAGDLVINSTGRGTLGRASVIPPHSGKVVAAVDLVISRLHTDLICPEYAALFLNSPPGLAQSEQFQTGSSGQLHLYPQHFAQFIIYLPRQKNGEVDLAWQKRLAAKVEAATVAKAAAHAKLEEAKQLVEKALAGG